MVTKFLVMVGVVASVLMFWQGTALADGGPHGPYSALGVNSSSGSAACQRCHAPHRATGANLVRATSTYNLCITCHGGTERTDVVNGLFLSGAGTYSTPNSYGSDNPAAGSPAYSHQLNGGRFGSGATSWHKVKDTEENTSRIIYGSSATDATDLTTTTFRCTSCHNPHGLTLQAAGATVSLFQTNGTTENYRMLVGKPVYSFESVGTTGNSVVGSLKSYTKQALAYKTGTEPGSGVSYFCATCHTDYMPTVIDTGSCVVCHSGAVVPPALMGAAEQPHHGSGGTRYVHMVNGRVHKFAGNLGTNMETSHYKLPVAQTDFYGFYQTNAAAPKDADAADHSKWVSGVLTAAALSSDGNYITCLTCHNAHGSVATAADVSTVYNRAGTHSLLRYDERAVCQTCHKKNPAPGY